MNVRGLDLAAVTTITGPGRSKGGGCYRAEVERPSSPACSEPERHAGRIPLRCTGGGGGWGER